MINENWRTCYTCWVFKPWTNYYKTPDWRQSTCKDCIRVKSAQKRHNKTYDPSVFQRAREMLAEWLSLSHVSVALTIPATLISRMKIERPESRAPVPVHKEYVPYWKKDTDFIITDISNRHIQSHKFCDLQ